jgi:hypothetical protein
MSLEADTLFVGLRRLVMMLNPVFACAGSDQDGGGAASGAQGKGG